MELKVASEKFSGDNMRDGIAASPRRLRLWNSCPRGLWVVAERQQAHRLPQAAHQLSSELLHSHQEPPASRWRWAHSLVTGSL
jgi:hypothetical protein